MFIALLSADIMRWPKQKEDPIPSSISYCNICFYRSFENWRGNYSIFTSGKEIPLCRHMLLFSKKRKPNYEALLIRH